MEESAPRVSAEGAMVAVDWVFWDGFVKWVCKVKLVNYRMEFLNWRIDEEK